MHKPPRPLSGQAFAVPASAERATQPTLRIALLTGADDRSYALGLTGSLLAHGVHVDFIGSDRVDGPELHGNPLVTFLNLRGDQSEDAPFIRKVTRILAYYFRLLKYAVVAEPKIFHILWNNKFEFFDRTGLMIFYRMLGRRVVITVHNVNAGRRDGRDSAWNRLTLRVQYRLADHLFVHTGRMKQELQQEFGVLDGKVTVIPFGINNTAPLTGMSRAQARERLGIGTEDRVALFFGQIAPYKGLDVLAAALPALVAQDTRFRLLIAGKVKLGSDAYWETIAQKLSRDGTAAAVIVRIAHIPDADVEQYFKAADVLVIPYRDIYQSGVPFLAYSFGLPVIATDVGSLRDDVVEGTTGFVCRPEDPGDLARAVSNYYSSRMYRGLEVSTRAEIRRIANERYSWARVADLTRSVYLSLISR